MPQVNWAEAVRQAIRSAMLRDPDVFILAEDVQNYREWSRGLFDEFGGDRVVNTPVTESGFVGMATGAGFLGKRAITEFVMIDWITVAMDMIVNQASKAHFMSAGQYRAPIVIKASIGVLGAPQMAQSLHGWFMQVPGIKILAPSDPYDAKGLMASAIEDDAPVLFIEHKKHQGMIGEVPEEDYRIPIGKGVIRKEGSDVTIVAVGTHIATAMKAATELQSREISAEVLDPRSLNPIDKDLFFTSMAKTGRLITVDEGISAGNATNEFLALASEEGLVRSFARVTAPNAWVSNSQHMQPLYPPNASKVVQAAEKMLQLVAR